MIEHCAKCQLQQFYILYLNVAYILLMCQYSYVCNKNKVNYIDLAVIFFTQARDFAYFFMKAGINQGGILNQIFIL